MGEEPGITTALLWVSQGWRLESIFTEHRASSKFWGYLVIDKSHFETVAHGQPLSKIVVVRVNEGG